MGHVRFNFERSCDTLLQQSEMALQPCENAH